MLRIMVKEARPGMMLARSLINPSQADSILLATGHTLEAPHIARLHELGVYDLWVRYPGLDFIDDLFSADMTTHQRRLCETLKLSFHAQAQSTHCKLPMNQYGDVVQDLVGTLIQDMRTMKFMSELDGVDDTLMRHSAEVCYLGVMIGLKIESYMLAQRKRQTGYRVRDVVSLGIGCMLHDIGETMLPEAHRESRIDTTATGDPWKQHVQLGYAMVRQQAEPAAAAVVLNHHQHFDGSGFPISDGKGKDMLQQGEQIHIFARIAAAADCFQHLSRSGGLRWPTVSTLWKMQQKPYCEWLDPIVLEALLAVVPPFLPGMAVKLSDQRDAVVTQTDLKTPCYPRVRVLQTLNPQGRQESRAEEIDLAADSKLWIQCVDGFDVSAYMFGSAVRAKSSSAEPVALCA